MNSTNIEGRISPIHVCSLSISALRKIHNQAKEEIEAGNHIDAYKLQWLDVAMAYNRKVQLQYIYQSLGSKGKSPAFRAIRMNPFWHQWKKEVLRGDWAILRECVDRRMSNQEIKDKSSFLHSQRIELAARTFLKSKFLNNLPINDVVNIKPVKKIYPFETPRAIRPGYLNQVIDLCASTQITTMSEVTASTTTHSSFADEEKPFQERFKELAAQRGFASKDDFEPEIGHYKQRDLGISSSVISTHVDSEENEGIEEEEEKTNESVHVKERSLQRQHSVKEPSKPDSTIYFFIVGLILLVCIVAGIKHIKWSRIPEAIKILLSNNENTEQNATTTNT